MQVDPVSPDSHQALFLAQQHFSGLLQIETLALACNFLF